MSVSAANELESWENGGQSSNKVPSRQPIEIEIDGLFGNVTTYRDQLWLCGTVYYLGKTICASELSGTLSGAIEQGRLESVLANFNGFFSVVFIYDDATYLISDKLRSRPLFYAHIDSTLVVTDDVEKLTQKMGDYAFRESAVNEFMAAGYVTGSETLVDGISQVQASEVVRVDGNDVNSSPYWLFVPRNGELSDQGVPSFFPDLDRSMTEATQRLIEVAHGRQIVVPLSGGYDSRIIAVYLAKLKYEKVITFTFGDKNSPEVYVSKRVADSLKMNWKFVQYSGGLWRGIKRSGLFNRYVRRINSLVSVPNVMVFPAVERLLNDGFIEPDAVLVPGHTGDFISGGHIPSSLLESQEKAKSFDLSDIISAIRKYHFSKSRKLFDSTMESKIRNQLQTLMEISGSANPVSIYEAWEARERQAKFTTNSNRYYDFFGLEWWMPLWDNDVVASFTEVPLCYRIKRKLWIEFVDHQMELVSGTATRHGSAGETDKKRSPKGFFGKRMRYLQDENHLWALIPYLTRLLSVAKMKKKSNVFFSYLAGFTLDMRRRDAQRVAKRNPIPPSPGR